MSVRVSRSRRCWTSPEMMFSPVRRGGGAAGAGHQEVMDGALPAAHAGADSFLLDVLAESGFLLSQLGVEGSGDVAGRVPPGLVAFEEELLGVLAGQLAEPAVHGLFFGAAQIGTEGCFLSEIPILSWGPMKRAALYMRVSTVDQHPETQLLDLRQMTAQRASRSSSSTPTASPERKPAGPGSIS